MINVLYTSHTPNMHMGGQISLYNLLKRLDKKKFSPMLVCPGPGSLSRACAKIGCDITYHSFPRIRPSSIWIIFKSFIKTFILLKTRRIRIIHSDHPTDTFYLAICAKLLKIPLVWHARVSFKSRLDPFNAKLAERIIGVSNGVSSRFQTGRRVSSKYVTIYNGVDTEKFRPGKDEDLRRQLGINSNEIVITTIGQITPEKGIYDFVASARLILDRDPNCKFLIAGEGNENEVARVNGEIIELGLQKHLHYLGFRNDVARILNVTDVFVLASFPYVEGLPRVVIEAMACGKPVVGTNVQGINEAVADGVTGLLAPPREPRELARAIMAVLEHENGRKEMGNAGRERAKSLFSIGENILKIQELYEQIKQDSQ